MYQTKHTFSDIYNRPQSTRGPGLFPSLLIGGALAGPLGAGVGILAATGMYAIPKILSGLHRLAELDKPDTGSRMWDTRAAATMRQSTIQAMHNSVYNLRAVLGNEASMLHR